MEEDLFPSDVETTAEFLITSPSRHLCSSSDVTLLDDPADCPNSDVLGIIGALVDAELSRAPEVLLLDESIVGLTLSSSPALVPAAGVARPRDGGADSCDFWYFSMVQSKT